MSFMDVRMKELLPTLFLVCLVLMTWIFVLVAGYRVAIKMVDTIG